MLRTNNHRITVLALDPSLTEFGYILIRNNRALKAGVIKTSPTNKKLRIRVADDRMRRISEINSVLKELIEEWGVNYIVSELPHGSQSAVAATALGMVSALVQTIADMKDMPMEWYSEADSKKCSLKKKTATKNEMVEKMKQLFPHFTVFTGIQYHDQAVADALSVYNTAIQKSPYLKLLKNEYKKTNY